MAVSEGVISYHNWKSLKKLIVLIGKVGKVSHQDKAQNRIFDQKVLLLLTLIMSELFLPILQNCKEAK